MNPNYLEFYDNTAPEHLRRYEGFTRIECVQRYPKPRSIPKSEGVHRLDESACSLSLQLLDSVYNKKQAYPSFEDGAYIQYVMEKRTNPTRNSVGRIYEI